MASRRFIAFGFLLLLASAFVSQTFAAEAEKKEDDVDVIEEDEKETPTESAKPAAPESSEVIEEVDEEVALLASKDFQSVVYFPEHLDKKFPIQTEIVLLFGVNNTGSSGFNVSFVGASFHSPYEYSFFMQNFTVREVGAMVAPGQQQTFEYRFKPSDRFTEPIEVWLSAWVIYNDTNSKMYQTLLFNSTIDLVDKPSEFNMKRLFTYVLGIAITGLAVFFVFGLNKSKSESKNGDDGWTATAYTPKSVKKTMSKKTVPENPKKDE